MKENAKTYILSKLTEIIKKAPTLKLLYKFDPLSREHLVKVFPLSEYQNNKDYHYFENELLFDFIEKYPNDGLVFLSENEWIDIDIPDKIFEGVSYFEESRLLEFNDLNEVNFNYNLLFSFDKIEEDMLNLSEIIDTYSVINTVNEFIIKQKNIFNQNFDADFSENVCCLDDENNKFKTKGFINEKIDNLNQNCDCNNYALAA